MRTFTQTALAAVFASVAHGSTYTTVTLDPPPAACCTTEWTDDATCAVLQNAVDAISTPSAAWTILSLNPGTYCNKNLYKNVNTPSSFRNSKLVGLNGYSYVKI